MIAELHGFTLGYDEQGSGPALLLIHAGIADRSMWVNQLAEFAVTHRVIAPDLRGFGESPAPLGEFDYVQGMLDLMDSLGIERATVVGGSMGGEVALDLALEHSDRVDRLVLVATRAAMEEASPELIDVWQRSETAFETGDIATAVSVEVQAWIIGSGRTAADLDPAFLDHTTRMIEGTWARMQSDAEVEAFLLEREPHRRYRLAEVRVPVLVVLGERDLPEVIESCNVLATGIAAARLETMADTSHLPPLEHPDEFNRLLREFLTAS